MQQENAQIIAAMPAKQPNSYPLRMPAELRERLEKAAEDEGVSVNALIIRLLQEALNRPHGDITAYSSSELLHEVIVRYGQMVKIEISTAGPSKDKRAKGEP